MHRIPIRNIASNSAVIANRIIVTCSFLGACCFALFLNWYCMEPSFGSIPAGQSYITVVFRYDDYSNKSPTECERILFAAFNTNKIPLTVGVIPYSASWNGGITPPSEEVPLNTLKARILKDAMQEGNVEVAQHGCNHQSNPLLSQPSELYSLSLKEQLSRIGKGKLILEEILGSEITVFIPPWNSYDNNTVKALEGLGFRSLSASRECMQTNSSALAFLPATTNIASLHDAIQATRQSNDPAPIVVVLFHPYDFIENNKNHAQMDLRHFAELLQWVASQQDIKVCTFDEAIHNDHSLTSARCVEYSRQCVWGRRFIPTFLLSYNWCYYPSPGRLRTRTIWLIVEAVVLYSAVFIISAAISMAYYYRILVVLRNQRRVLKYGSVVALSVLMLFIFRNLDFRWIRILFITALCGIMVGIMLKRMHRLCARRPRLES
jgi:peptidoglycan/xylan/chitin deacetylase (PgdA/CDA1 family)